MLNAGIKGLPADASAVVPDVPSAANQTEMEAASSTTKFTTPGTEKFHPGVAKAWAHVTISGGTPTLAAGHNFSASITDHGAGDFTLTFTSALSSAFYSVVATAQYTGIAIMFVKTQSTTAIRIFIAESGGAGLDAPAFSLVVFGDFS